MYTEHFGLNEAPFSIAPNPHYLYMSQRHQDALAHLLYGIQSDGGFILLTGEVGTGKTTLCRCVLNQIPEDVETAFVLNPRVTATELLATICDEFGVPYHNASSIKDLVDALNAYLLTNHSKGKKAVLIIDEAQNLTTELLEQLRLLTNLETSERKLLQIILLGQPELLDMLANNNLRQFSQRITARFHLHALNRSEASQYISHRLEVAGGNPLLFDNAARRRVFALSQGIPRVINLICDRALLGAYSQGRKKVTTGIVSKAAKEVLGSHRQQNSSAISMKLLGSVAAICLLAIAFSAAWLISSDGRSGRLEGEPGLTESAPDATISEVVTTTEPDTIATTPTEEPGLNVLPEAEAIGHQELQSAYHDLFTLWGSAFEDQATPACELASVVGLGCYRFAGPLSELQRLNRPVIVVYNGNYVTLSASDDQQMTLIAANQQSTISRSAFESQFAGQGYLLWRMPPAYEKPLVLNDTGPAVDWLVIQLALINNEPPPLDTGARFSRHVEEKLRKFQFSMGLPATGEAGPLTWIHLNGSADINTPTLSDKQSNGVGAR